jgi:catechol 2,3-dioxygenase-like lactoylglutathione lyase family enzyme
MVRVSGLHRIGLRVVDLNEMSDFYRDIWSMELIDSNPGQRFFKSRGENHSDLVLRQGNPPGLDFVALSVSSEAVLDQLLGKLEAAGASIVQLPVPGERFGESRVAAVDDLDGNRIELVVSNTARTHTAETTRSVHLGHVVLWTPQIEQQEAFYALLGFQVSDRTHMGMSFLRCNTDHHSIALALSTGGRHGLQHVAFDVETTDRVMQEYGRLRSKNLECIWGVGRHGPGNNVFSYYRDPEGNVIEFYGEMEQVASADVAETRYWGPEHKGDISGKAGPPPQAFRR